MTEQRTTGGDAAIDGLVQLALARLRENNVEMAEILLSQAIAADPRKSRALHLMGLVRRAQNRLGDAVEFFRQSLSAAPAQPQVHHDLGNALRVLGRLDEAVAEFRKAVGLKANFAEAHFDLAVALSLKGEHEAAVKSCRDALRVQPNYVAAKQMLAAELCEIGRLAEAEKLLRTTLAIGTRDVRQAAMLEHNLAIALTMQRRHEEALPLFDSAQAKAPDLPAVDYNRANALQSLGRSDEAVAHYRRAIACDPLHLAAHRDLNHLLYRLDKNEDWLKSYDDAAALYPDAGELLLDKADFWFLRREFAEARDAFERAAQIVPDSGRLHVGMGMCLTETGDFDAAIREFEAALRIRPEDAIVWRSFSETLLRLGDGRASLRAAERALAIAPQDQVSLALWGLALRMLGDPREEEINDVERLVRVYDIAPPPGSGDVESFNRELNAWLDGVHRDKREFLDQTLRAGTQTLGNLFGTGHGLIEALRTRIDGAVADYIEQMKPDVNHPLFSRKQSSFSYVGSWSSRLHDCGFHTNHVHGKGWISSAYYVALPDAVESTEKKEGWIKFGEPNFACAIREPVRRAVQPRVGTLVLFPSYMWHGTVPFHSRQSRTTIAFDVVPQPRP